MTLSRAEIELIIAEIVPLAGQTAVQRVLEVDRNTRVLQLRRPGHTHLLLASTAPNFTRLHLVGQRPDQPDKPTAFTMQLRKWVGGALLDGIGLVNNDRVVRLELSAVDPEWAPESAPSPDGQAPRIPMSLILELTGRHPNWFLVDGHDVIVGQLHDEVLGPRDLGRDSQWEPPPSPPDPSVGDRVRWKLDSCDAGSFDRSRRLAHHYDCAQCEHALAETRTDIKSRLTRRINRLDRRIDHVKQDLQRAENADEYKRRGELLQSAWGDVNRGAKSVNVPDFYDPTMPQVQVPLDPALDLEENIEQYFHDYHRLRDARTKIQNRLSASIDQRKSAADALAQVDDHCENLGTLEAFSDRLIAGGILPTPPDPFSSASPEGPKPPFREFRTLQDTPILVGRGAADNDTLTTSIARGRDMWFHARDWPGAHVVLRMPKNNDGPTSPDLVDAATLAAWFSKGKNDTLVDVTYTQAKYVRKPNGSPAGSVSIADASTIGVAIEQDRLERLLATE